MTALPAALRCLPLDDKLALLDLLWSDIKAAPEHQPPAWHGEVLAERERAFRSGESQPLNFEQLAREWRKSRQA